MVNKKIFIGLLIAVIAILAARQVTGFIDLTADQRYTLSEESLMQIQKLENPIKIDIFLSGNLPPEYLRLRNEIKTLLNIFQDQNPKITFEFIALFDMENQTATVIEEMSAFGMPPEQVFQNEKGNVNEYLIFPWAVLNDGTRSVKIPLTQKRLGDSESQKIQRSIQQLEYQFMDGLYQLSLKEKKNIAVLTSHGTSESAKIYDFLHSLKPYYNLANFDFKAPLTPQKTLENLTRFDLLILSNPNEPFTQTEKFILDQYTIRGGKSLWMIDTAAIDRDSLFNLTGETLAMPKNLNLEDFFFKNGIRFQNKLVRDIYSAPIVIAQGNQNDTNYFPFPWVYYPLPNPSKLHPISHNTGNVLMQFANPVDTLKNELRKHILLQSSDYIQTRGLPAVIQLEEATQKIKPQDFNESAVHLGVLVEGHFKSLFNNRVKPFELKTFQSKGNSKMLVICDGNFAENQLERGQPLELGYDKWTNNFYANKTFLRNAVHFLADKDNRIALKNKSIAVALLDARKLNAHGDSWKISMTALPFLLGILLMVLHNYVRKKKYEQ